MCRLWLEGLCGRLVFTGIAVLAHRSLPGTSVPCVSPGAQLMSPCLFPAAGDRNSVGSEGSIGSIRSAGSGQSTEGTNGQSTGILIENVRVGTSARSPRSALGWR